MANGPHKQDCCPASFSEPEMRRWPHPVNCAGTEEADDAALHFIRCALSYQNQLLADIKSLLERLVVETEAENVEK